MDGWFEPREEVNPARAGMIPNVSTTGKWQARKPRASGDDPAKDP